MADAVEIIEIAQQGPPGPKGRAGTGSTPTVDFVTDVYPIPDYIYDDGAGTITSNAPGILPLQIGEDGGEPGDEGSVVLVPFESTYVEGQANINAVYVLTNPGSDSEAFVLTKSTDIVANPGDLVLVAYDYAIGGPSTWVDTSFGVFEPVQPWVGAGSNSGDHSAGISFFNGSLNNPNGAGASVLVSGEYDGEGAGRFEAFIESPDQTREYGVLFTPQGIILQLESASYQLSPYSPPPAVQTDDFNAGQNDWFSTQVFNADHDVTFDVGAPTYVNFAPAAGAAGTFYDIWNIGTGNVNIGCINVNGHIVTSPATVAPGERKRVMIYLRDITDPDNPQSYWIVA